jgi:hypothetical protein
MIKIYNHDDSETEFSNPEWCRDNLEYDLCSTDWIIEKVKSDKIYAQHIYAALCNNSFQKNEMWPILSGKEWRCSWRHAGRIVANLREEGDYIDWYCSGIQTYESIDDEVFQNLDDYQKREFFETNAYVAESIVTEEIREDLFKLGWIVVEDKLSD